MNINNPNIIDKDNKLDLSCKENAMIKLHTIYVNEQDEEDETELVTTGTFSHNGSYTLIQYEDTEATGFSDCKTKLIANGNDLVNILRKGDNVGSDLTVQCDKKLYSQYMTPAGSMCVGILASDIQNNFDCNGGSLYMKYTIDINGTFVSENEIYIEVTLLSSKNNNDESLNINS